MRINTELLFKIARDHIASQTRGVHDIVAVFAHGALLEDDPLPGGAGDIDLFFIRDRMMDQDERQIVRVMDDILLDIVNTPRENYRQPRDLRVHPWLGPVIYNCNILYDPQHFMDFAQASVRGQFERPDNIARRSRTLMEQARQVWVGFLGSHAQGTPQEILSYLRAVEDASNALVVLNGVPLTERRFLLRFPPYATAVGRPGLSAALHGLLGIPHARQSMVAEWMENWQAAFPLVPSAQAKGYLDPVRLNYYTRFFDSLMAPEQPYQAILWPLLNIWTTTVSTLSADAPERQGWLAMARQLNLLESGFESRLEALDAYLDMVEETLEEWSRVYGA